MRHDIENQLAIIEQSIDWAKKYGKEDTFPIEQMKEYRRVLKRYYSALEENCSAAAYGESQVGKSYLMSSLLSSPGKPFVITNNGHDYSFIDEINPSGGNTTKTESTGVVTRFTVSEGDLKMKDYVKVKNLTVSDIIMLLADTYYNDIKIDVSNSLRYDDINERIDKLQPIWVGKQCAVQEILTEDDIKDICDYIKDVLGSSAASVVQSKFRNVIGKNIQYIPSEKWTDVFALLWNNNPEMNRLFSFLIKEYRTINFQTDVYVPFSAVLRNQGTLLKVEWLNALFGAQDGNDTEVPYVSVFDKSGNRLAKSFRKSSLSALIAELTFNVPKSLTEERRFLEKIDLLDFPGARSREKFKEEEIKTVLPTMLRRGKIAYLFNKYSRSLRISAVLFCHHNDQKSESTLGATITEWIEINIGKTPEARTESLTRTGGISPLFFIATKFNFELERSKMDHPGNTETLEEHWKRFVTVIPEIIKPAKWFDQWVTKGGIFSSEAFQGVYLLRDFYWSSKNQVFDGYVENESQEKTVHKFEDYPEYFNNLKESFLRNDFVKSHFANPEHAWNSVATINNDGSKTIIRDLDNIANNLDEARSIRYGNELNGIKKGMLDKLKVYYEPEDKEQNNKRVRTIIGDIRRKMDLGIGSHPEIFGCVIDRLMIPVSDIRKIAYDVIILKTETPKDFNEISVLRVAAGIKVGEDKEENIQRLCDYYTCDVNTLREDLARKGFTIEDVVSNECTVATKVTDVVANAIFRYWADFINSQAKALAEYIPHPDEVAFMLQNLCATTGVKKIISKKLETYYKIFPDENDLPNAIADFSSLVLNNFVSTIGSEYMGKDDLNAISQKAKTCNIHIDMPSKKEGEPERVSLEESLKALDSVTEYGSVPIEVLEKLPFWGNYLRWKNQMAMGLLYSADVSHTDPVANTAIKNLIDQCSKLYKG